MTDGYPRDLRGYGRTPPDPGWPGDARIAVQFVLNFEEGGENSVLHGDVGSEPYLTEVVGAAAVAGRRNLPVESMYEYGTRAGFWRIHRLFTSRGVPLTVYGVTAALMRNPEPVAAMREAGWEIASHGLRWIDYGALPEPIERQHIAEVVRLHTEATGERPLGWYCGRVSERTRRLVVEEGGFVYDSDSYADDLPYFEDVGGRRILIVPYTLDTNDFRFLMPQGFPHGDSFFAYLKDAFDVLYAEGEMQPKLLNVGLHCRIVGRPGRIAALARFLDHVLSHERVFIPRRIDLARHWIERFG